MPSTGTTATTTQVNEVCIGFIAFNIATSTDSPTNSFTEVTERPSGAPDLTVLERIVSATGAYGSSVSWTGGSPPLTYGDCGVIATFKSGDATVNLSTSTATAAALTPSENHGSSISIGLMTASGIMPNTNIQVGSQVTLSISSATATSPNVSLNVGSSLTAPVSTATANSTGTIENHGSSIAVLVSSATAQLNGIITEIYTTISVSTSTATAPSPTENHGSSTTLTLMISSADSIDADAIVDSGSSRRIIITSS